VGPATLGTGFTYQGLPRASSGPVDGVACDFQFRLWNAATGGSLIGPLLVRTIPVNKGLFTAVLDFGPSAFDGNNRWIEVAVRCPSDTDLTTLTPRQALTPAPYALFAQTAANLSLPFNTIGIQAAPEALFGVENKGTGTGLSGRSQISAGVFGSSPVRGVHGNSDGSPNGIGVLGTNTSGGIGVWAESNTGPATVAKSISGNPIEARGTKRNMEANKAMAAELRHEARATLETIVEHIPADELRAAFTALPEIRRFIGRPH